jgi:hypothetical protein
MKRLGEIMLKIIAIVVVIFICAVGVYAATRPDSFRIQRSITIHSTPDKIFPLISNFHQWELWSPWEKIDPQIQRTYSGEQQGKGAVYAWRGDKNIGQGRMEMTDATPPAKLTIQLDFITPFEARNTVEFTLEGQGNATLVSQAMHGPSPFISKIMGLFFNMEKMVGGKYEEGLANLKVLAEKEMPTGIAR